MGEMITAREAMARAIDRAEHGDIELGQLWLAIARELREGSRPKPFAPGGIVRGPVPVIGDMGPETLVRPRPFERRSETSPLDATALVDYEFDAERASDGARQVAHVLRSMDDHPQRYVTGVAETEEQRLRRTPRPFVQELSEGIERTRERFDAFAAGREETQILDAGDPSTCRHCGHEIYEAAPEDVGTAYRYRHKLTGQAVCPTPPRHMSEQGDESYVSGPHTMAEPGGMPYRAG
jgi:hypothetical protein